MNGKKFDINSLRVASPCSVGWEAMTGDERARHCASCNLNVYNVSEMTEPQARDLIESREGRLCIRMFRRHDGTVSTKDCPVGLRAYKKRAARFAGAALAAVFGLFSVSFGQRDGEKKLDDSNVKITRTKQNDKTKSAAITGNVNDEASAVVGRAKVELIGNDNVEKTIYSDEDGNFALSDIAPGKYSLEVSSPGFKKKRVKEISVTHEFATDLKVTLTVDAQEIMGIFATEPEAVTIDMSSTSITTTIRPRP